MKKSWFLALLIVALGPLAATAQDDKAAESLESRVSYIIGLQLGSNFRDDTFEIDVDRFVKGLRDALANADPEVTEEEMQQTMMEFQEKILAQEQARMESLSDENEKEGAEFLDKN
jgi:FKBP-type peptidyl-prolyl cis-trans isomerase FklB